MRPSIRNPGGRLDGGNTGCQRRLLPQALRPAQSARTRAHSRRGRWNAEFRIVDTLGIPRRGQADANRLAALRQSGPGLRRARPRAGAYAPAARRGALAKGDLAQAGRRAPRRAPTRTATPRQAGRSSCSTPTGESTTQLRRREACSPHGSARTTAAYRPSSTSGSRSPLPEPTHRAPERLHPRARGGGRLHADLVRAGLRRPTPDATRARDPRPRRRGPHNAEIARTLWVAQSTVAKHLEHAYSKLGVHSRTAAVAQLANHRANRTAVTTCKRSVGTCRLPGPATDTPTWASVRE